MKKKKMMIIIVIIAAVAAFAVYYMFFMDKGEEEEAVPTKSEELAEIYYYTSPTGYFVTNINESAVLSKTSVYLAMSGDDQTEFLTTHDAIIRNVVLKVLLSHSEEEMRAVGAVDMLEEEIAANIRSELGIEGLEYVYISDFVIQ